MTAAAPARPAAPLGLSRPTSARGRELALLLAAAVVVVVAWVALQAARGNAAPGSALGVLAGAVLLGGAAHLAVRRFAPHADPLLLPAVLLLDGLGLVVVHRLDLAAADRARSLGRALPRADAVLQSVWSVLGVVGFVAVLAVVRDHRRLQRSTYTAMVGGLLLLVLPAVLPASVSEVNGARNWIRLGGFSVQPGEFAKLGLIVFFAGYLVAKRDVLSLVGRRVAGVGLPRGRDLGPVLLAWLLSLAVLVAERAIGTSLLFFGIFLAVLYVATERVSWLLVGGVLFGLGTALAAKAFHHVGDRFTIWLHAFDPAVINPPSGRPGSYQLVQGLYGMATGGLLGTGLGEGRPDLVPFAKTDFVVAAIGEELGLAGLMALLVVYLVVVLRGMRTAVAVQDPFGKLLAAGLASALALQVVVVVGGVTRLIPLSGMTLPWVAYGGSSLLANWLLLALLVRISDAARRPLAPATAAR